MWQITIEKCPECGREHKDLEFNSLPNPPMVGGKMKYLIGQCPVTLGQIFKDSIPFPARLEFDECITKEDYERILATLPGADVTGYLSEYVQAVKERDEARAQMLAAIGALQELSMDPGLAGVPFWVLTEIGSKLIIEHRKVENIYYALEKHAKKLLPFGKEAINKAYKYDGLLLKAKDLQAEVERLRGAVLDAKEPAKTIDDLRDAIRQLQESLYAEKGWVAKYRDAHVAHGAEIVKLKAEIERLEARRTCVHVNVAGDCSVAAKNRKLEAEVTRLGAIVASSTIRHTCVHADHVPVRIWPDASVAGECSVMAEKRQLEDKLYKMLDTVESLQKQLKAAQLQEGKEVDVTPLTNKVVNLTYFKSSGKYYSSGSFIVAYDAMFWDVVTQVRCMMEDGRLPGLTPGAEDFVVHMTYDGLPHVLIPKEKA